MNNATASVQEAAYRRNPGKYGPESDIARLRKGMRKKHRILRQVAGEVARRPAEKADQ